MPATTEPYGPPTIAPADGSSSTRWTVDSLTSAHEVRDVCREHNLREAVSLALQLAVRAFSPVNDIRAEVDVDPDTNERRIVIDVTADAGVDELMRRYGIYTREWVSAAPADVRQWVRLAFHPLRDQ